MKKSKVLVSAYACGPNRGSEPGMGWNFVTGLAKYHEIHVISEKLKWEKPVRNFLKQNPELKENLKFHFILKKRNKLLRKLWPPSYYWFYKEWQKKAYLLAVKLDNKENFDIIHQLNMVGYREPGFLWKIDKPFVWGPIGGLENSPWKFLPSLGLKGMIYFSGRNLFNLWQRNFLSRPRKAANRKNSTLISATKGNALLIKKLWGKDSPIISEVGQEVDIKKEPNQRLPNERLNIIWSGKHTAGKNLPLILSALTKIKADIELNILGDGEMTKVWKKKAVKLGISNLCAWHGWLDRNEAINVMRKGHVFCITSISDLTATVTLEALSYGLPIICLDHCGFSNVINNSCGMKIPINSPKAAILNFSDAIDKIYKNEKFRQKLILGAYKRSEEYNWKNKVIRLNKIYEQLK